MSGLLWVAESMLLGCLLVCRFTDLPSIGPRWARLVLIFGAGAVGGIGVSSCLFFLFGVLTGIPLAAMAVELLLLAWAGCEVFRRRIRVFHSTTWAGPPLLVTFAALALLLVLGLATLSIWVSLDANPQGNWDGWAIWNLRAKFLASGAGLAQRAWSPVLGATTHPEYPLLLSGFIGRCWAFSRTLAVSVPAATAFVFFLALLALAAGCIGVIRGPFLGILIALSLAATPGLWHEVPSLYADVPLACFFLAALVFALLDRPALAGVFAGFAAWTKDEGLAFLVLFLAATVVFRRRTFLTALLGSVPVGAILVFFRLALARGNHSLLSTSLPGAAHRIADLGRYGAILSAVAGEVRAMAAGWYHPILPFLVLTVMLKFDRERRRDVTYCGSVLAALLLSYFGVFVVTNNDLNWQLQGSLSRLLLQLWPALLLTGFAALRAPQAQPIEQPAPASRRQKRDKSPALHRS